MTRALMATFLTVFLAEMLDKTQLMVLALGAKAESGTERLGIFVAASVALAFSSGIAVYLSGFLARLEAHQRTFELVAGVIIALVGVAMVVGALRNSGG